MKGGQTLSALALGLGVTVALLWGLTSTQDDVQAGAATLYVNGKLGNDGGMLDPNDCTARAHPCQTIQHAVDQAIRGGQILVTGGTYNDLHQREGVTQVVYLDRSVTIRGGYNFDFHTWDPAKYETTLDAEEQGRVIYVPENVTPTLEGLRITNGWAGSHHSGGGIYATSAAPRIDGCWIYSNAAGACGAGILLHDSVGAGLTGNAIHHNRHADDGGGVCVSGGRDVTLADNHVYANAGGGISVRYSENPALLDNEITQNEADAGYGGGIRVFQTPGATLTGNQVSGNAASRDGGGIYVSLSDDALLEDNTISDNESGQSGGGISSGSVVTLVGNQIFSNTAAGAGGGVDLRGSECAALTDNQIYSNTAATASGVNAFNSPDITLSSNEIHHNSASGDCGGVQFSFTRAALTGNAIVSNTASGGGGGVCLVSSAATLVNNIVAGNRITATGGGLWLVYAHLDLLHDTLAHNTGGDGSGICVLVPGSVVTSVNTMLVGHTVGITAAEGTTVTLEATVWGDGARGNRSDWDGAGAIATGSVNIWGDPAFVDPARGDYHIRPVSAAAGSGIDAGVSEDIDGEGRPAPGGSRPDIGADEVTQWRALLPLVLRGS
jgi:parallel beta-helix repeat protein